MPSQLYIKGKLPDSRIPAVAIIGSRKPSRYGEEVTYKLAYELAKQGIVIVSGLAYGIDAIAHTAALDAGGTTIAVLAQGLHRVYPVDHTALAERIVEHGGAIISEQPAGVEAHKFHFLARNRIVSGLADAVVVTEATQKSGTLSTITHALDQNKEVFAVPGPITSLLSVGPHRLIQQGAGLVTNVHDILQVVAPTPPARSHQAHLPLAHTPIEAAIYACIQKGTSDVDTILHTIKAPDSEILQAITHMELRNEIKIEAGDVYLLS